MGREYSRDHSWLVDQMCHPLCNFDKCEELLATEVAWGVLEGWKGYVNDYNWLVDQMCLPLCSSDNVES